MADPVSAGEIIGAFLPIVGLVVNVLSQLAFARLSNGKGLLKSVFKGFAVGLFAVIALEMYLYLNGTQPVSESIFLALANILAYGSLGYCYFHFINLGETARRVRIIAELAESENGLTLDELLKRYNARTMIEKRLQRLIHTGQILNREGRYFIGNPSVLRMAQIIQTMNLIVFGKKKGFE